MSTIGTKYDDAALAGNAITRDARELLGEVMGFVAVTVGFAAFGAYLGRDLSGGTGLVVFIGAFACIFGLNIAAAKGREQLAIGFLFGLGLLLGLAVAPVIADYAKADPSALWQAAGVTAAFVIQPVPGYAYEAAKHTAIDPRWKLLGHERSGQGYPLLKQAVERADFPGRHIVWAAELQQSFGEAVYLDIAHYTAAFSKALAAFISAQLSTRGFFEAKHDIRP